MEHPYSIEYPEASELPQLTTFYSFKGGVGRTQSLYNVGVRLAALRRKVLMVDVDLEAPGLSIGALGDQERNSKDGFAEIARDLLLELEVTIGEGDPDLFAEVIADYQKRLDRTLHVIDVPMPPRQEGLAERLREEMGVTNLPTGSLALLSSGRIDPDYPRKMIDVSIDEAFQNNLNKGQQDRLPELLDAAGLNLPGVPDNLGLVFTAVLRHLFRNATDPRTEDRFRHVLIDSRSGLADVGGLCLRGLPDTRVVLSGLNTQNVEGTQMVLNTLSREERDEEKLIIVFSPVPEGEVDLLEERIRSAKKTLTFRDPDGKDRISDDQIRLLHYHPRIALEEKPFTESFHERTRIYDEYEELTDRLLALTGSDADSLVDQALELFQKEATTDDEHRYRQLAQGLLPASFVDPRQVKSLVEGLCNHASRIEGHDSTLLPIFHLWISLPPADVESLITTATFIANLAREDDVNNKNKFSLYEESFSLYERASEKTQKHSRLWNNWGSSLGEFADQIRTSDPEKATNLYEDSSSKLGRAVKIDPEMYGAWYNWGKCLGNLAELYQDADPEESLYFDAFNKYERAVELNPESYDVWYTWGEDLGDFAKLTEEIDPDFSESLHRNALEKFGRAAELNPEDHAVWGNWGTELVRLSRLLNSQGRDSEDTLSRAIEKLQRSLSEEKDERGLFWLIVAFVERDDIEEAAELLDNALEEAPGFAYWFDSEDAEAVRAHPELREILDEYRERVDEDELEDVDSLDEVDPTDLSE